MIPTKVFVAFSAVFVVVTLSLLLAVNDQRAALSVPITKTETVRPYFLDSFVGSAWAAEQVTDKTLFVSGSATASASPDKVTIQFSIVTEDVSAQVSQQENADKTAAVRSALIAKGMAASDIETTGYSLSQIREYNYETRTYTDKGFRTTHSMKIELADIGKAGEMIDAAVSGGANSVTSVYFGLSDDKMEDLTMQALEAAGGNAKEKAESMAKGLGVTVTRLMSASEGYTTFPSPSYRSYAMEVAEDATGGVSTTEVTPGDITVTATVNAVYEIA
jgi:uncharacterized protein YggE